MESRCSRYEIPILQSRNKNGVQLSTEVERIGRATDRNTRQDQAACQHAVSSRIIKKHNSKQEWTAALQRHQSGKLPHPACHCRQRRRRIHHLHHLVGKGATQYWKNKPFKDRIWRQWEEWMINEGILTGTTTPPTRGHIVQWTLNAMNGMSHDIVFNAWRHGRYTWFPTTAPPAIENN